MIGLHAEIKKAFFDSVKVQRRMDKQVRTGLLKSGAFIRRTARQSMKSRKKSVSKPGSPPFAHGNPLLKNHLYFAYDEQNKSVIVGPVQLSKYRSDHIPLVLEVGGIIKKLTKKRGMVERHYQPRPYMKPAFDVNVPKVAALIAKASPL